MPTRKHATAAAGASPRPVRTVDVTLDLDGYIGWTAKMQSNLPLRILDDLDKTSEFDTMRDAVVNLIVEHTFPLDGDLRGELNAEEVWALRRGYITALNEATTPSKSSGDSAVGVPG